MCNRNIEVVSAADVSSEVLEKFSEECGTKKLYTDYKEMLERENLDIVSICTWPASHYQMVMESVKAGVKGILCEKPLTLKLSEGRKIIDECEKNDCCLTVCHQRRYEGRYVKAKELLDNKEIGNLMKIIAYQGDLFTDEHTIKKYGCKRKWI